jgi:alkylation response protein AidB-like acyl-CoA dehydrogenase
VDFELSDEQLLLRDASRRLLEAHSPLTEVRRLADTDTGFDPEVWARGAELGWPILAVDEAAGGAGGDLVDLAIVAEELGRMVHPGPLQPTSIVAIAAARHADLGLRDQVVESIADGSATGAWAFAELGSPWSLAGIRSTATKTTGGYELSGTKTAVHGAVGARWMLITALLDGAPASFLVDTDRTPVPTRSLAALDLTRRLADVDLDGIVVEESARLGAADESATQRLLDEATLLVCADAIGVGAHLLAATVEYAKVRVQFDRPIGSFQAIKHKCATMRIWLQASQAATYYAAMALAENAPDARKATSVAKAYVSDAINRLAAQALQVHGGIGMTWEHDLHLYLRRAKSDGILCGDATLHRLRLCDQVSAGGALAMAGSPRKDAS